ncbi:MAG: SPOR domain-containing protein [Treponema sp.]|nr:SPOR domain-containing protein [Treponema sp.]
MKNLKKTMVFIMFFLTLSILLPCVVYPQTGISLEAEIQNIERTINRQGISAADKQQSLIQLARLRQLTGDIEGAARNWLEAATAIPGRVDENALLSCAYCLAAMGEWDRALAALEPMLSRNIRARFLDITIKAIKSGDVSGLTLLADHPEFSELKAEILFMLWKVSGRFNGSSDRYRLRLINEFPQTLEGRLAAGESSSIIVRPNPFWLFAGGLDSLPLVETASAPRVNPASSGTSSTGTTSASTSAPVTQTPTQTSIPSQTTPVQTTAVSGPRLQTGIFSQQANAQTLAANLRSAGFSPTIEQRVVNGNPMWAVTVPVGQDQARTVSALRAAGFDSFLIR